MAAVLNLLTFLLLLGAGAEEIIGGHEVKPHSHPYMAFIESFHDDGKWHRCGGFLVQDDFVLTAAHCRGRSMKVTLGAHDISIQEETQQIIPVAEAIPHPAYNPQDSSSDIMLLKLERKAKRTNAVRPLRLPRANTQVKVGNVCYLTGWGKKSLQDTKRNTLLQEAVLIIQDDQKCKQLFRRYSKTMQICAGDPKKVQAPFKGDSGGPLVCNNRAYEVLSYGKNQTISSGIFTKVVSFLPWIKRSMKPLYQAVETCCT